jgi:Zn-dependent protease
MRFPGLTVGPIMGVRVRIHFTWVIALAVIIAFIADIGPPGGQLLAEPLRWLMAAAVAALFFVSVLAHELAHAVIARRRGVPVSQFTLYVFGGPGSVEESASDARSEAVIAGAGPLVSLAAAALLLGGWVASSDASQASLLIGGVCWWAGMANLLLGVFNLMPAFPLDGGRLMRALFWAMTGNYLTGSRRSALVGSWIGIGLVALGLAWALAFREDQMLGIWVALTGWLLRQAARITYQRTELGELVAGVTVGELMERDVAAIGPNLTLDTLLDQDARGEGGGFYPVTERGRLVGTLDVGRARATPRAKWPLTRVNDVMASGDELLTLTEDTDALAALERFERLRAAAFAVVDAADPEMLRGILTRRRLGEALQARAAKGGA